MSEENRPVAKPGRGKVIVYGVCFIIFVMVTYCYSAIFLVNAVMFGSAGNDIITLVYAIFALIFLFGFDRRKWCEGFKMQNKALSLLFVITPLATALIDKYKLITIDFINRSILIVDLLAVIICILFFSVVISLFEKYLE